MAFRAATVACTVSAAVACSNLLLSPGATVDESSIISYNADSVELYGSLYHYPASKNKKGSMRDVYNWDEGTFMGQIPEAEETYNVIGNMNEYALTIGETTAGGLEDLQGTQSKAIIDYGSLIYITLQRSKTAREAIKTIGDLMDNYGYASEGESFSIADPNEVWVMEIMGKGEYELGAVWVARKIPDGYVSGHANQMRITTFPLDKPDDTLYSKDVITFARKIGAFDGADEDFSFSDVYDPVTFEGARFCEGRVWSFFGSIMGQEWADQYADYAMGFNLTNRMPLWVQPPTKISALDVMEHMRNHFEGSSLAFTEDVGAGAFESPYRWRPLTWDLNDKTYVNERAIGTQQTGWNFVAQMRRSLPRELGGLLWFGVDDSATTVRFPIFGSATSPPSAFAGAGTQDGVTPPMFDFNMDSAHNVFNLVANWAYTRWNIMYPELKAKIMAKEQQYWADVQAVTADALQIYNSKGPEAAVEYTTEFSSKVGNALVKEWGALFGQMFSKYRDGYTITPNPESTACGCTTENPGYGDKTYQRIVDETGDQYLDMDYAVKAEQATGKPKTRSKLALKALR
mmetsp:Transcript_9391/g.22274  ORF Transcript_9391/g.22274 Transcript_9391/m.22274 type:complete len:573 (-) Transcript_9391:375-2093(-)|eukprot:CAMPEP_0119514372 /NCGR_PEP_ID=MMETSP1344-20130328/32215_1 /TAXON_ID=236787 /ORGANISM="Florenciella parvula, Strain CCMP2471" /LENGTH=572 /DNA_ID=CAMNT_0007551693 /DNA_START=45 /DNA_END=1763 /DNA_ORIENTATION=-